jgi:hypothetical protein
LLHRKLVSQVHPEAQQVIIEKFGFERKKLLTESFA